jgi:hypothetical protein
MTQGVRWRALANIRDFFYIVGSTAWRAAAAIWVRRPAISARMPDEISTHMHIDSATERNAATHTTDHSHSPGAGGMGMGNDCSLLSEILRWERERQRKSERRWGCGRVSSTTTG